ncbi:MAG: hypothetical protein MUP09_04980 [Thiovulaceae bacterium]|nr:hypothetical protein [Sulfurimonadaceae bacterium]
MTNEYLQNVLQEYREVLENAIWLDFYRFHRYDVPFSMATFYSDKHDVMDMLRAFVRQTDTVVELNSHLVCVIYGNIGYAEAFKASENLLYDLNSIHPNVKISAGMTSVKTSDLPKDLLRRVLQNLGHASEKDESYVGDDYIIDYLIKKGFKSIN